MTYNNLGMRPQIFVMCEACVCLASLYGEMKKYTESELMFKKAIQMNPTYTEAYFNLGQ